LVEIKDLLIAPILYHFHGLMAYWNNGKLGLKVEKVFFQKR